ncbi:MAG: c-type cytochrome biogenesis protein CcmI [Alphaproteobacteria bacterium]
MAWLILGIIAWGVLMFLVVPLIKKPNPSLNSQVEISAYKTEITRLEAEVAKTPDPELEARKLDLQRQLLALTKQRDSETSAPALLITNSLFAFFIFGAIGLYALLGSPDLTTSDALEYMAPPTQQASEMPADTESLAELLTLLKSKLDTTQKNDAKGWMLYARTLMNIGNYAEAFKAYEKVLALTGNDPNVAEELEYAKGFAKNPQAAPNSSAERRGPSAGDIEAAAAMTPEDRAAMIENMVSGLAAKLRNTPDDPDGWVKLLNARRVLGQTEAAKDDIALVKSTYVDAPDTATLILTQSGWPDLQDK